LLICQSRASLRGAGIRKTRICGPAIKKNGPAGGADGSDSGARLTFGIWRTAAHQWDKQNPPAGARPRRIGLLSANANRGSHDLNQISIYLQYVSYAGREHCGIARRDEAYASDGK